MVLVAVHKDSEDKKMKFNDMEDGLPVKSRPTYEQGQSDRVQDS